MNRIAIIIPLLIIWSFSALAQSNQSMDNKFVISANGKEMAASFANNSSAMAFRELIADAPLTVAMSDYGNFEKVGDLGHTLPTNDTRITTEPGDVILYLGNNITIYYGVNTWTFTRLGKIDGNPTRESILAVLGNGTVNVTFSLNSPYDGIKGTSATKALSVSINGRSIDVATANNAGVMSVYNTDGKAVYSGTCRHIGLPAAGLYLIECGGAKTKVLVK